MGSRPSMRTVFWHGTPRWLIDWRAFFRDQFEPDPPHLHAGMMRHFHVVFRIRIRESGTLAFWSDDGCIIRREGRILYEDRGSHGLTGSSLLVASGDELEIALAQFGGDWAWAGGLIWPCVQVSDIQAAFEPYRDRIVRRLEQPTGPVLKLYTNAASPVRVVLSVYSMILHGYAPQEVMLFGEHQWSPNARATLREWLPFAQVIPTHEVTNRLRNLGGDGLAEMALRHWYVMKACIALLEPPKEACVMDDDVVTLDSVDDAIRAFETHDLVFSSEVSYGPEYARVWRDLFSHTTCPGTENLSAGLVWLRQTYDPTWLASVMVALPPEKAQADLAGNSFAMWYWEQGLMAMVFADRPHVALSSQRYLFPPIDGLPGGILGYSWEQNPCRFATIHFCDTRSARPGDEITVALAPGVLGRNRAESGSPKPEVPFRRVREALHTVSPYEGFPLAEYAPTFETWPTNDPIFHQLIVKQRPNRIIEVGSWLGASAVNMGRVCREFAITCREIVCIDTWLGGADMIIQQTADGTVVPHPFSRSLNRKHGYPQIYYTFLRNVIEAGLEDLITPLPMPSSAAYWILKRLGVTADLIYVDAAHEFDAVLDDLRKFWQLLEPGGVLIGDDYDEAHLPGVRAAAHMFSDEVRRPIDVVDGKFIITNP
jgi:predicted O-methyltransferase YrrM